MKPLCLLPWNSIDIGTEGTIKPCCKYTVADDKKLNVKQVSIENYTNSTFLNDIKDTMLKNEWPEGCIRCKTEEDSSIKSKRQLDYERWSTEFDTYTEDKGYIIATIAFGNTCNLKCITCSPTASSRWHKEYIDLYGIDRSPVRIISSQATEIYEAMPNLMHFDIAGGEPLLSEIKKQKQLLRYYIDSGKSKDITLHYTTNAQVFPDDEWWDIWSNFLEIDMQLSIDGVDTRYEYIRYPASNKILEDSVKNYKQKVQDTNNLRLSISHTISAYNIYYLSEFFDWCEIRGLPTPWCGVVTTPKHMRPTVFPKLVKEKIIQHLNSSRHQDVHTWANYLSTNDSSEHFDYFLQMKDAHDVYRNLNFANTFPEVEELLDVVK
jgi:hypothetical protein|tara:strand:- start:1607 stop:2740 length:1134 start_codon:yes stop_codon:yes gene_type:complete